MKDNALIRTEEVQHKIFTIRGVQVMLDKDLATLYEIQPRRLREQVKRNINRFPEDFMFQLTDEEVDLMVSQNATPSRQVFGGSLPYVFTEQGVASLSGVLTSKKAAEVHIHIMRAFVNMRRFITANAQIFQRLNSLEIKQIDTDKKIEKVLNAIEDKEIKPKQGIFFDGQIFDAYHFLSDLIRSATRSITLIDNYIDDTILTLFSKRNKNVPVTILTKTISKQLELDTKKFNEQYPPILIKKFHNAHIVF